MIRVKFFYACVVEDTEVQEEINKFLEGKSFIDLKQTESISADGEYYNINYTLIYEEV